MSRRLGTGSTYAGLLTAAALLAAGCIPGSASPSPDRTAAQAATASPTIPAPPTELGTVPVPTANPTATSAASARAAQWVAAGALNPPRALTHAIPITGGNVLVVGDDWTNCNAEGPALQEAAADAEVYQAETGTWKAVASLNALRSRSRRPDAVLAGVRTRRQP